MRRKDKIHKNCNRCGNDLLLGQSLFHLPYEKRYIAFCGICHKGLNLPDELFENKSLNAEQWHEFWDQEIDG